MGQRSDLVEPVTNALLQRPGTRPRTAGDGEKWLDCRCPLHDDAHRSASYSTDQGTFVCRVCDPSHAIPLDRVAAALAVQAPLHGNGSTPTAPKLSEPLIEAARWSYDYYWPNGELSHHHWRIQYANIDPRTGKPKKTYKFQAPSGDWNRPGTYYPLYADLGIPVGAHIVVTEGEPSCDVINSRELRLAGIEVHAVTAGSTSDMVAARPILLARLRELESSTVTLWPDADEPGVKAMRELRKYLQENHIPAILLKPEDYQLANKDDAVEFLQRGGNLALLLTALQRPTGGPKPVDVAERITVLRDGALWPGTQSLVRIDQTNCSAMWQSVTGHMPLDREAKELSNVLKHKAATEPVDAFWRLRIDHRSVLWLPQAGADCYQLSEEGIDIVRGPEKGVVLSPGPAAIPPEVDPTLNGEGYYRELCQFFGLSELEQTLILAWWVCCLTGRETPIMLMRGAAGTGKSTLASFILGIVEPSLREINLNSNRQWSDERQLIQTLRQVPAVLIDNVSALSASMEDTLSQLVTGYSTSVMWKFSNDVEQVRMRRGIILTTTNYEVYKGDLASRIIVVTPAIEGGWVDRDLINERFMPMLPAIRGWVFKQVCRAYLPHTADGSFRVASVGDVLSALGYDASALAAEEAQAKAQVLSQNDPWMWAIVDMWDQYNEGGEFLYSYAQIVDRMRELGVPLESLPQVGSQKFARWVEEKRMLLRDHGFYLERYHDKNTRGYWFRRAR